MIHIFLINSYAGKRTFADGLRKKLKEVPNLHYFVFNTRRAGEEENLIRQIQEIFEDEKLRFYCCGGSGTMRNVLNGFDGLENVEIAFYPCGLTNDFIKVFGTDAERFRDIRELIHGDVIEVDYIRSNAGVMLNTFSMGMDTITVRDMERLRFLRVISDNLPYNLGVVHALLSTGTQKYILETEGGVYQGKVTELFFGNGNVLGGNLYFFEHADPVDGKAGFRLIKQRPGLTCIPVMIALIKKDYKYLKKVSVVEKTRFLKLRREDGGEILINQDGELVRGIREWTAEIVPKGLKLIVPKGVRL